LALYRFQTSRYSSREGTDAGKTFGVKKKKPDFIANAERVKLLYLFGLLVFL